MAANIDTFDTRTCDDLVERALALAARAADERDAAE
jgi:hypothetical protein